MRAVLGKDAVDTKRNRFAAARAKKLVHSHQDSNAIGEYETKGQSESNLVVQARCDPVALQGNYT